MPVYAFECSREENHQGKGTFRSEGFLQSWKSENPGCDICGIPMERVWAGRQYHAGLGIFPLTTRAIDGNLRTYDSRGDYERAVKAAGLRIRDDASWLDEDLHGGTGPVYNWKTGKTEYPSRHTTLGGKGTWF